MNRLCGLPIVEADLIIGKNVININ